MDVDSTRIIQQTCAIQEHFKTEKLCQLSLPDLASIVVATKCCPEQWSSLLNNRKTQPNSLIESVARLARNNTDTLRNPFDAAHLLMCAPLTSTAKQSQPFLEFCEALSAEPSVATQTLYFLLPFAISHRSSFNGSAQFDNWFPCCATYQGYQNFENQQSFSETEQYRESINSIFRKLDFSQVEAVIPSEMADKYGLHAPKPVAIKDYMDLHLELVENVKKIRSQQHRAEIDKITNYEKRISKLEAALGKNVNMKAKHLQKKIAKSAELLSVMELNKIDEQVIRTQLCTSYYDSIPKLLLKQQRVNVDKLDYAGHLDAYNFTPPPVTEHTTIDQLESYVKKIADVIEVLSKYSV